MVDVVELDRDPIEDRPLWAQDRCLTRLWVEDECTRHDPDAETLTIAWCRLFGTSYQPNDVIAKYDAGDAFAYLMPYGRVVWHSFDGDSICQARFIEVIK